MSGPVDVLARAVERLRAPHPDHAQDAANNEAAIALHEWGAAVAQLVEADREYDAAYAAAGELRDGVSTIGEVAHAEGALRRAQSRRATALARCGGAKRARLTAAAPKLLKALQAIVASLAEHDDEGMIEHAEQMIAARAAIAEATGETP